jgi:hypothetical protein
MTGGQIQRGAMVVRKLELDFSDRRDAAGFYVVDSFFDGKYFRLARTKSSESLMNSLLEPRNVVE